jgi:hypothetical protein
MEMCYKRIKILSMIIWIVVLINNFILICNIMKICDKFYDFYEIKFIKFLSEKLLFPETFLSLRDLDNK